MTPFNERDREALETLDGARRRNIGAAAVRLQDMAGLLPLQQLQSAKAGGATPTQAEFDALVEDVHRIHQRLTAIAEALRDRQL